MENVTDTQTGPLAVDILREHEPVDHSTGSTSSDTTGNTNKGTNTPTAPSPAPFDSDAFGASLAKHLAPIVSASSKPGEAKSTMTPEAARKLLKVWEPDDAWFQKFGNLDTQRAAVLEMRDAIFQQAATFNLAHANELREKLLDEINTKYGPVAERFSAAEARDQQSRFTKAYPALANDALIPHIATVAAQLEASGALAGKTEAQAFEILGKACETAFRAVNPAFSLSGSGSSVSAQPTRKTNGNPNAQPTTSSGGGSAGSGGGGGPVSGKPLAVQILSGR